MAIKLSQNVKTLLDLVLSLVGLTVTELVQNSAKFSQPWGTILGIAGAPLGYLISDLTTIVNTGTLPATSVIQQQVKTTWTDVRPSVVAQVAKITNPNEQAIVNSIIAVVDSQVAKLPTTATP